MTTKLEKFINGIITAPTIEEERVLITNELANMRTKVKDMEERQKPRLVAKLLYLDTYGYDTAWGQMEVISLMTNDRPSYKRIGYIAAAHMFDEANERIVLITATVQKDLASSNPAVQRLALTLIANICSAEMGQSLATDVIRLASSHDPMVQKCAGTAAVKIIRRCPELSDQFRPIVAAMLNHGYHSVVASGILIACEMLKIDPSLAEPWNQFVVPFTKILKTLFDTRPSQEFQFGIFNDPFLQVRILQILAMLKSPSDELDDVLSSIVTGVDIQRNTGRSLLLQAVHTIGQSAKKASLRSLAFNQVGRLFTFPQPNLLYSALSMFSKILYNDSSVIDRSSSDSVVLQRYKSQIVHCLDHRDPSIRRRALDVVAALVDETNVESLVPEIMSYLKLADTDFRAELVAKVFASIQRFAPSVTWNFDTVLKLLKDSGNYVGNDVITLFCKLIAQNVDIRTHAMTELYNAISTELDTQPLIQVAAWALGEFQEEPNDSPEIMVRLLSMPQTSVDTKCYLITAVAKLAVRFNLLEPAKLTLQQFAKNNNLEIQQRSGELLRVIANTQLYDEILAPVEVEEAEARQVEPGASTAAAGAAPKKEKGAVVDLLEIGDELLMIEEKEEDKPAPKANQGLAAELLGLIDGPAPEAAAKPEAKAVEGPPGAVEALRTSEYVIYFEIQKNAANPRQLAIRSSVFNLGDVPLNQFVIQYGVPQGWAIAAQPPSGMVLEPKGGRPIQQVMMLENRGMNPLMMMTQTSYMYRTQPIKETGRINPIFN